VVITTGSAIRDVSESSGSWSALVLALIVVLGFVSILVHNFWYGIFGFEDVVFFSIVIFIIPLYLIISIIYSLYVKISGGKK